MRGINMKMYKKAVFFLLFGIIFNFGGCKSMEVIENMEVTESKDGVFAIMETDEGNIVLQLHYKETPLTVTNFVGLAEGTLDAANGKPYYDGLKFHRVIENFMIQGGDPNGTGSGGPGYKFADEIVSTLKHDSAGVLSMANAGAGTNGSQFFITHNATPHLDGMHTVFGKVLEGQDVVDSIAQDDEITKLTIVRNGTDAEAFTATQADFDLQSKIAVEKAAAENEKEFAAVIEQIENQFPDAQEDENGIFYRITEKGSGGKTGTGKQVSTHYRGYLLDGKTFDSSERTDPISFGTDTGQMIPGFDIMVQDMEVGEKRTIILPPETAYGAAGIPGFIPANSYVCFDVELMSVN